MAMGQAIGGGPRPRPYGPAAVRARRELALEEQRAEGLALRAIDAAWDLAFPGAPSEEAQYWCELGELAEHWDRLATEAELGAPGAATLFVPMCRPVPAAALSDSHCAG